MSISIIEKVLGNNNFLLDIYYKDTINLVKSIVVKTSSEAGTYNTFLFNNYGLVADEQDLTTWRYYKHLSCQYHSVDKPVFVVSVDNFTNVEVTIANLNLHKKTRERLLEFGLMYTELVDRFPEQELYIKSCIVNSNIPVLDITLVEDFTIIGYNKFLVEDNELELMHSLQELIDNYKVTWLLSFYSLSDTLFLTTQYVIFYQYLITSVLSLRLINAKTNKAHSFHVKNYLASHHNLDMYYDHLTREQALFLYRNLLYLNTHAGKNIIFNLLIDKLFTVRNISIVTYDAKQINSLDVDSHIEYKFNQRLLNTKNLIQSNEDFSLLAIKNKELSLAKSNEKYLDFELGYIDERLKNSLFNTLLTKDIESIVIDLSDSVPQKLVPTIVDYWAFLLKTNRMNYVINFINPVTNTETNLPVKDAFKLFIILLYKINDIDITEFPPYTVQRVYKEPLPDTNQLLLGCYRIYYWFKAKIDTIKSLMPSYINMVTSSLFNEFINKIYLLNIGLWLDDSNTSDKDTRGQFELIIKKLHTTEDYIFNDETVNDFLVRYNMELITDNSVSALEDLNTSILDSIYDNKLLTFFSSKAIQKAMVEVFKNFKSYTTQILGNHTVNDVLSAGFRDTRLVIEEDVIAMQYVHPFIELSVTTDSMVHLTEVMNVNVDNTHSYSYSDSVEVLVTNSYIVEHKSISKVDVRFGITDVSTTNDEYIVSPSTNDELSFIIENPL